MENEIILTALWKITELNLPPELQSCLFFMSLHISSILHTGNFVCSYQFVSV